MDGAMRLGQGNMCFWYLYDMTDTDDNSFTIGAANENIKQHQSRSIFIY